jgi:hypothetical protein
MSNHVVSASTPSSSTPGALPLPAAAFVPVFVATMQSRSLDQLSSIAIDLGGNDRCVSIRSLVSEESSLGAPPPPYVHATAMRLVCLLPLSLSLSTSLSLSLSLFLSLSPYISFSCPLSPTLRDVATDTWDFVKNAIVISALIEATEYQPMLYI